MTVQCTLRTALMQSKRSHKSCTSVRVVLQVQGEAGPARVSINTLGPATSILGVITTM